jgi:hypothetical protein
MFNTIKQKMQLRPDILYILDHEKRKYHFSLPFILFITHIEGNQIYLYKTILQGNYFNFLLY